MAAGKDELSMIHRCLIAAALAVLAIRGPSQDAAPEPPAWPELSRREQTQVKQTCDQLRKTGKAERIADLEQRLQQFGAGAAPLLIDRLSDMRKNINAPLQRVLEHLVTDADAPLLARRAQDDRLAIRRYVVGRLERTGNRDMLPVFRHALGDDDDEVRLAAVLGITRCGDTAALPQLLEHCIADWHAVRARAEPALAGVKGRAAAEWLATPLSDDSEPRKVAALRMLRVAGDRQSTALIAPLLDSENHNLKRAAINALRGIVDGDPPLDKLSVFQAIEMAKTWKARL